MEKSIAYFLTEKLADNKANIQQAMKWFALFWQANVKKWLLKWATVKK